MSVFEKPKPCFQCGSRQRRTGENWKTACPQHEGLARLVFSSVDEIIRYEVPQATLADLEAAWDFERGRRGGKRKTVLNRIRIQINRLRAQKGKHECEKV